MWMTLVLHGTLRDAFGATHRLAVATPAEAIRAMASNHRGWYQALRGGQFRLVDRTRQNVSMLLDCQEATLQGRRELHLLPVIAGGKSGFFRIIFGVALIALAAFTGGAGLALGGFTLSGSSIAMTGLSMLVGGVADLLMRPPSVSNYGNRERVEDRPSYLIGGTVNTMEAGSVIPLVYGRRLVGSVTVSVGFSVEEVIQ